MFISTVATGECVCRGDPHCFAFDANRFNKKHDLHIPNICAYSLATDGCEDMSSLSYNIVAKFERVKHISSVKSFVSGLTIFYQPEHAGGNVQTTYINQGLEVTFRDLSVERHTLQEFPKEIEGHHFEMVPAVFSHPHDFSKGVTEVLSYTLPNGVNVQYDGIKAVKINNDALSSETPRCGICGNDDGIYDEQDILLGGNVDGRFCPGLPANGTRMEVAKNKEQFVNSWFIYSTGEMCDEICPFEFN
ncbi:hypothetical protein CAPTEDRAFT_213465 [Capitella teleta]|uniref:VWFD domain-containing protein n=1 Tax=Capitella teleta TaxID=283909 RepID=R7TGY2_CAPTE|nr:hypothetical protein CAPTEDRAFT_213465 [Capitella teleta]|eukprot:ELT93073.1 hypothetical protein CAPTEDRAFT_213465 [Capitella teleta]